MDIIDLIAKYYLNQNINTLGKINPNPKFIKPNNFKPLIPINYVSSKKIVLSTCIANQAIKKHNDKIILDILKDKNSDDNNQKPQIKWEDIVSFGIVGIGICAFYAYSGYKISLIPAQIKN